MVTNRLPQGWRFYDFQPDNIRDGSIFSQIRHRDLIVSIEDLETELGLHSYGANLNLLLSYWHEHDIDRFQAVNDELQNCTGLCLEKNKDNGDNDLYLQEGAETGFPYEKPIPLHRASDGTLRLMAYHSRDEPYTKPSINYSEQVKAQLT